MQGNAYKIGVIFSERTGTVFGTVRGDQIEERLSAKASLCKKYSQCSRISTVVIDASYYASAYNMDEEQVIDAVYFADACGEFNSSFDAMEWNKKRIDHMNLHGIF